MIKECVQCGTNFSAQSGQVGRFCSRDCHGLHDRSKPTHNLHGEKRCSVCKKIKPATDFHLVKDNRWKQRDSYLQGRCRSCNSEYMKKWSVDHPTHIKEHARKMNLKRFKMSESDYLLILEKQSGGCAICKCTTTDSTGRKLSIDHIHGTGNVRGLLCHNCNVALGLFKEDVGLLVEAICYLARHIALSRN